MCYMGTEIEFLDTTNEMLNLGFYQDDLKRYLEKKRREREQLKKLKEKNKNGK